MTKSVTNIAASVRAKLINVANKTGKDYNQILRLFFQERFLYRLSVSQYKHAFILKGALLLVMKDISRFRPTKDIDFLGKGISNDINDCKNILKEIAEIDTHDGVRYLASEISGEIIKAEDEYPGIRFHIPCRLDTIKNNLSIDVGFGDKITHVIKETSFPALLDLPAPVIHTYSMESAVAEKFEAIVSLQLQTSRMKDFFDLIFIAERTEFNLQKLREAVNTTFTERKTDKEDRLQIFSDKFKNDAQKHMQWQSFLKRSELAMKLNFDEAVEKIEKFIEPVFTDSESKNWDYNDWVWK